MIGDKIFIIMTDMNLSQRFIVRFTLVFLYYHNDLLYNAITYTACSNPF